MTSSCGFRATDRRRFGTNHPIVVTLAARLEAINALPGAKRRSPRIMPDETKLSSTDCASHGLVRPVIFQTVKHCCLLLACAHFGCTKTKRIVTNGSIERGLSWGIQRGATMIRRLRRVLEFRPLRSGDCFRPPEASITSHAGLASQSSSR